MFHEKKSRATMIFLVSLVVFFRELFFVFQKKKTKQNKTKKKKRKNAFEDFSKTKKKSPKDI